LTLTYDIDIIKDKSITIRQAEKHLHWMHAAYICMCGGPLAPGEYVRKLKMKHLNLNGFLGSS